MIIDLKTITHFPRRLAFAYGPEWWKSELGDDGQILGLDGPLSATLEVYKAGDKYVLEGKLSGRLEIRCDRCAEAYVEGLSTDFRLFLAPPPPDGYPEETVLRTEDLTGDFIVDDQVELDDLIREQIYLSVPMKSLCRKDCLGLCPECGADLNQGDCRCRKDHKHPALAKLKHLQLQGE
jgi:uncharacterized protein